MLNQTQIDYQRVEKAIAFIKANFKDQPSLNDIAAAAHTSPFHFQRLFKDWAGVSPKKFTQYLSLKYAKRLLSECDLSLLDVAHETGLSGSGRLHDLFVNIECMSPGEFKSGGSNLKINYSFATSPFGNILVASTQTGVCHIAFEHDESQGLARLMARFPRATFHASSDRHQQAALHIFQQDWQQLDDIKLHLAGTPFQLKVWESLLRIPFGGLVTYGNIAQRIGHPSASRAVGTAIGSNPIAYLIPCHRVIASSGALGGYMWGETRKSAIIGWEAAQVETTHVV